MMVASHEYRCDSTSVGQRAARSLSERWPAVSQREGHNVRSRPSTRAPFQSSDGGASWGSTALVCQALKQMPSESLSGGKARGTADVHPNTSSAVPRSAVPSGGGGRTAELVPLRSGGLLSCVEICPDRARRQFFRWHSRASKHRRRTIAAHLCQGRSGSRSWPVNSGSSRSRRTFTFCWAQASARAALGHLGIANPWRVFSPDCYGAKTAPAFLKSSCETAAQNGGRNLSRTGASPASSAKL